MARVFHISDLHFLHTKMAIKRGFNDSYSHDNHIIDCWNKVVHKNDKVFVHGDLTMEKTEGYKLLDKLKGSKTVLLGNHDLPQHIPELLKYVDKVAGAIRYNGYWLTHIPVHISEFDYRIKGNIHGHLHENNVQKNIGNDDYEKFIPDTHYINVSCEQPYINYTPQLFTELIKLQN